MPNIRFGNIDFSGDGAYIWGTGQYSAPTRSVDFIDVPGRNGDLLVDNGKYNNTTAIFQVIVTGDVEKNTNRLKYLLYSQKGYQKLYDSDMKGFYRMASFNNGFEIVSKDGGVIELQFDCKPLRYDINGETPLIFDVEEHQGQIEVFNPYFETAHPIIKLYGGSGSIKLYGGKYGKYGYEVQITDRGEGHIIIDTDVMSAYSYSDINDESSEKVNRNKDITDLDLFLYPELTSMEVLGDYTKIEIVPRWVTI